MNTCCRAICERWYREHLYARGGADAERMRASLVTLGEQAVPLLVEGLRAFCELRVVVSKRTSPAFAVPLNCGRCKGLAVLVVLSVQLDMLIWRIQMVLLSLIDAWEVTTGGTTRVAWHDPTPEDVRRFAEAVDLYLGSARGSLAWEDAFEEIVTAHWEAPESARANLVVAYVVALFWVAGHELGHALADGASRLGAVNLAIVDDVNRLGQLAASHTKRLATAAGLSDATIRKWQREFHADLLSCYLLLHALADRAAATDPEEVRQAVGTLLAAGVTTALNGMDLIGSYRRDADDHRDWREGSHPPLDQRWELMRAYIRNVVSPGPSYDLFWLARLIQELDEALIRAYQGARDLPAGRSSGGSGASPTTTLDAPRRMADLEAMDGL